MSELLKAKIHYLEHRFNLDGRDNVNYLNRIIEGRMQQIFEDHCGIKQEPEQIRTIDIHVQPKTFAKSIIVNFTVTKTGIITDKGWK